MTKQWWSMWRFCRVLTFLPEYVILLHGVYCNLSSSVLWWGSWSSSGSQPFLACGPLSESSVYVGPFIKFLVSGSCLQFHLRNTSSLNFSDWFNFNSRKNIGLLEKKIEMKVQIDGENLFAELSFHDCSALCPVSGHDWRPWLWTTLTVYAFTNNNNKTFSICALDQFLPD